MCFMKRASLIVVGCVATEARTCCTTVQISYSLERTVQHRRQTEASGRPRETTKKDKTSPEQQESGRKVTLLDAAMHRRLNYKWG